MSVTSRSIKTGDGEYIALDHYEGGHSKAVVISHGFFNSKDATLIQKTKECLIDAYDVIVFDYRGHGKSSGTYTWTAKEPLDLLHVLEYTKKRYAAIGIVGFSYGAAIALTTAAHEKGIDSVIAISPPYDSTKVDFRFWNLDVQNDILYNLGQGGRHKGVRPGPFWLEKEKPIDLVQKISCPVLYIHGDKDWVIDHAHSAKLYDKTTAKKKIAFIKNGSHAEYLLRPKTAQETIALMQGWFRETL